MNHRSAIAFSPGAAGPVLAVVTNWRDRAACAGADPDLFFPPPGGPTQPAKDICAVCPVRGECLEDALETRDPHGIRGGLDEDERRELLRQRPQTPPPYCRKGLHKRTPENTYAGGRCRPCKLAKEAQYRADERVVRTGSSSPQSGKRVA